MEDFLVLEYMDLFFKKGVKGIFIPYFFLFIKSTPIGAPTRIPIINPMNNCTANEL